MTKLLIVVLAVAGIGYVVAINYSYVFSRKVDGVIENIERVEVNVSLLQQSAGANQALPSELHSFAVAIKQADGEIVTSSAEDRQWAVAKPGQCVEARYYPYPPWNLSKSGTYYGARLLKLSECPGK